MDDVFGEENLVGTVIWKNATDNNPTNISVEHEYILCFARKKEALPPIWKIVGDHNTAYGRKYRSQKGQPTGKILIKAEGPQDDAQGAEDHDQLFPGDLGEDGGQVQSAGIDISLGC